MTTVFPDVFSFRTTLRFLSNDSAQNIYISQIDVLGINDSVILKSDFIPEQKVKDYFCAEEIDVKKQK